MKQYRNLKKDEIRRILSDSSDVRALVNQKEHLRLLYEVNDHLASELTARAYTRYLQTPRRNNQPVTVTYSTDLIAKEFEKTRFIRVVCDRIARTVHVSLKRHGIAVRKVTVHYAWIVSTRQMQLTATIHTRHSL